MSGLIFKYWGKAKPGDIDGARCHLLPYHCLDVAAVGVTYLKRSNSMRQWLQRAFEFPTEEALLGWFAFWLALHDLGKFSEAFQSQREDIFSLMRERTPNAAKVYRVRHDTLGMLVWKDFVSRFVANRQWFGSQTDDYLDGLDAWARAVTGHHGQPPEEGGFWGQHFDQSSDGQAVEEFVDDVRAIFLPELRIYLDPERFRKTSQQLSWWIAGLAVLTDWIGSNTDYFRYHDDRDNPQSLSSYWEYARRQAEKALDATGVVPIKAARERPFSGLFPAITRPSPLQTWAVQVEVGAEQSIYLLEDITGAGKTEAAVVLTHRMMAAGVADGFFIGLPTMATANAMYGRIAEVYADLFGAEASLVLAHGQRHLVESFATTVLRPGREEDDAEQSDETATARCTAWLADHNKRALLASAGVGTLDQALLAVLHSKHQSLRLLGLFRKVLIVDEVHACDNYMQRVLETLLEFHASAGGSVILLSATLPMAMKQALLNAYGRGRSIKNAPTLMERRYPLVTSWHTDQPAKVKEHVLQSRPDVCRSVSVQYVSEEDEVLRLIEHAWTAGQCVCWMRNTVFDAAEACSKLRARLPEASITLFHARFALHDRLFTEGNILEFFGKDSESDQRQGKLVIATQVAEQSLDADWDVVISDLAPIDRLIQRAGRLQRHVRDAHGNRLRAAGARDGRGQPKLWVYGPQWTNNPPADWYRAKFPKAFAVYPHHGQLWLTARSLNKGTIEMPDDARDFIESVFGKGVEIPAGLRDNANKAQGAVYADRSVAHQNVVKLASGYLRGSIDWWSEAKTPSRLGEATANVVLARWEGDHLHPWVDGKHGWAYSSLRVAERLFARRVEGETPAHEAVIRATEDLLPGKGKWSVLLTLRETTHGWIGSAWTRKDDRRDERRLEWRYDAQMGLQQLTLNTESDEDNE
jgi:CRISPR-associated endonuclease/helicase Cas3